MTRRRRGRGWGVCLLTLALPMSAAHARGMDAADYVSTYRAWAHELEAAGDLHGAVLRWQAVLAISKDDIEAAQAVRRIDQARATRARAGYAQGMAAMDRGNERAATLAFLRVLAVDPGHADAAAALRSLKSAQVARQQANKSETEDRQRAAALRERVPPR